MDLLKFYKILCKIESFTKYEECIFQKDIIYYVNIKISQ